ncbi:MAG: BA14K family protein [Pseudomonadota bacterium]
MAACYRYLTEGFIQRLTIETAGKYQTMKSKIKIALIAVLALPIVAGPALTGAQSAQAQSLFGQVNKAMKSNIERASNAGKHLRWCRKAYRSYRKSDDSYSNYAGKRVRCRSPFRG